MNGGHEVNAEDPSNLSWAAVKQAVAESGPAHQREVCLARLSEHPQCGPTLISLGNALADMGQYEEAEKLLQDALENCPERLSHLVQRALGELYKSQQRWVEAEHAFQAAMIGREDDATSYIYLGTCYALQGRLDEAEAQHRRGTECGEGCIDEAWLNLGLVLRARRRYEEAESCFEQALEMDPEYRAAARALADVKEARKIRDRELSPGDDGSG